MFARGERPEKHAPGCACERCFAPVIAAIAQRGDYASVELDAQPPTTAAELRGRLRDAYLAGVRDGRRASR